MTALLDTIRNAMPTGLTGSLVEITGMTAAVADFPAPLGALVHIDSDAAQPIAAEVVGFRGQLTIVCPFDELRGTRHGSRVRLARTRRSLRVGNALLGRVINAHGQSIDGRPAPMLDCEVPLRRSPPLASERPRIAETLPTGVRAIDSLNRCGRGQRMGVFAGPGVGKSVLLGMMSRYTAADVVVIGLVGERGRELNDFIERDLGPSGLARSVIVVATSNEPALVRVQAANTATSVAEYFRDQGKDVLLIIDSVTRFALAQREVGLAAGEPPATRGYPPSVFAELPRLVERAGRAAKGSITAFYSVLVEGDDPQEPIADALRGLLDGHLWLSRKLAQAGHFPAIDPLDSLSRLMNDIAPPDHVAAARAIRASLAAYRDKEDLIAVGAYRRGSDRVVDAAIDHRDKINAFLQQAVEEPADMQATMQQLLSLSASLNLGAAAVPAASVATPAPPRT
jgi:FliI/YscN family ATPase